MAKVKHALLDTDFISKMYLIRNDNQNRLIDKIISMPNYIFYCHKQILMELNRHNVTETSVWLKDKISSKSIYIYDDEMILNELKNIYGSIAIKMYLRMLKNACDAYKIDYFQENFINISQINYLSINVNEFLKCLQKDCDEIGEGKNLGELKSFILLQTLNQKFGSQLYVFCSDDKNARNGVINIGGARCISVVSSFIRMKEEINLTKQEAKPYFEFYIHNCLINQTTFKVQDNSKEKKMIRVPCEQVFNEIYNGKIEELKSGNLKYK